MSNDSMAHESWRKVGFDTGGSDWPSQSNYNRLLRLKTFAETKIRNY